MYETTDCAATTGYLSTSGTSVADGDWLTFSAGPGITIGTDPCEVKAYEGEPVETLTHLIYKMPYPGLKKDEIEIYSRRELLVIDHKDARFIPVGKIEIFIDWEIYDKNKIEAALEDGVLTVSIAKVIEDKKVTIK